MSPAEISTEFLFYTDLLGLGLRDAYRSCQSDGTDHSWLSSRFGNQRLDHALIDDTIGVLRECRYDHTPRNNDLIDHVTLHATIHLRR